MKKTVCRIAMASLVVSGLVVGLADANATPVSKASRSHGVSRPRPTPVKAVRAAKPAIHHLASVPVHKPSLPRPGTQTVDLSAAGTWVGLGKAGIALASTDGQARTVTVQVLSDQAARALGQSGITLRLSSAIPGAVAVSIPSKTLRDVYGPSFSAHPRWLALADCTASSCARSRSLKTRTVNADAQSAPAIAGAAVARRADTAPSPSTSATFTTAVGPQATFAAASAPANQSNGSGDFSATPVNPSSQWTVSPQTGDYTWTYPLRVPPSAAGPTPNLSIGYDSNSLNGQTGATNNQPSQVGEGFNITGESYIERSYTPCNLDGVTTSADECWKNDNATVTLDGQTSTLVKNSAGVWGFGQDTNIKVEHLTSNTTYCSNNTYDNDCWRLTTADGTQYYFGRNKLPGWTTGKSTTNSAWTVPVFGNNTGEPCYNATFSAASCVQAWRWNLDYVVDLHGNSEAFYYTTETNKYAINNSTTASAQYVRGGYLARIDYGMHASYELSQSAPDQVVFTAANRCDNVAANGACPTTPPCTPTLTTGCATAPTGTAATYWPDDKIAFSDDYCIATSCAGKPAPTFWSTQRIAAITTQYWNGSAYVPVDTWALTNAWPDPGDGSLPGMTLTGIQHKGLVGGNLTMPTTSFGYSWLTSRVAPPNGIVPLETARLTQIVTETGAQITINYQASNCSGTSPATPQTNTLRCFPQYWAATGGTPSLDWFNIYPVSSVIANPETGGTLDASDTTTYDYGNGLPAYRLDTSPLVPDGYRTWSVFAGYNKVRVEHGDPATPNTLHTTDYTYLRGMDGDIADTSGTRRSVTVTASDGTSIKDSPWWAGHNLETVTYDGLGGSQVSDVVTTPCAIGSAIGPSGWCLSSPTSPVATGVGSTEKIGTSGSTFTYTPVVYYTGTLTALTYSPLSTGTPGRTTQTDNQFDSVGRVVKAEDLGDTSTSTDDQCSVTSYVDNTTLNIYDLPDDVHTYAGTCAALPTTPGTATISDVRTSYDGHAWAATPACAGTQTQAPCNIGDVTQTQQASGYSGTTASWLTTGTATYDAIGRTLTSTDAMSRKTQTLYVPAAPASGQAFTGNIGPVTQETATDPMGFATTKTVSPAWGVTTTQTDVNSHVTTAQYDPLGRRTAVWMPDRSTSQTPSDSFSYSVTAGQPVAVGSSTLTPTGGTQTSYQLYDGLLRPIQTQDPAEASTYNAAPGSGGSIVNGTGYDSAGQVVITNNAYTVAAAPSATRQDPQNEQNVGSSTQTIYDGDGRPTAVITDQNGTELWRTTTTYPGVDRIDVTPPAGGTPTSSFTDARGRTTQLRQYGDTNVPGGYDTTSYTYYPTGQIHTMVNQASETWTWTYDVLGRITAAGDPATGTTNYSYDADNELQSTTDANGTTLWRTYDADGRPTATNQTSATGPLLDSWSYDTLPAAKGLLTSATSYIGSVAGTPGTPYAESTTGYDAAGRPLGLSTTLPSGTLGAGSAAFTYTQTLTYNADGTPNTTADPIAGTLPAETIANTYTSLGRIYSIKGRQDYLDTSAYNPNGTLSGTTQYTGVGRLTNAYTYSPGTNRLTGTATSTTYNGGSANQIANVAYSYDNAGDVTAISDAPLSGAADNQCFSYDYLQRLQTAWTPSSGSCTAPPTSSTLGGAAPYWQSYTYATDGNRRTATNHATSSGAVDQQDTYSYPTSTAPQPTAVTSVVHATAPAGSGSYTATGTDHYGYDTDGQTTTAAAATIGWTPQGQIASVTSAGKTQNRIYDAFGNLLVQVDPINGTVVYVGDAELKVAANSTAVTGERLYTAFGRTIAVRQGTTSVNFLSTDPEGTATITYSYANGATTVRYLDPFGSARGSIPTWPSDRGFLGAPTDPFSSLTHLGARDYNPALGRFLSPDPVLTPGNPQQNNGYAYADNNPVTQSDPSGLVTACDAEPVACQADGGADIFNGNDAQGQPNMSPSTPNGCGRSDGCRANICNTGENYACGGTDQPDQQARQAIAQMIVKQQLHVLLHQGCSGIGCLGDALKGAGKIALNTVVSPARCLTNPSVSGCVNAIVTVVAVGCTVLSDGACAPLASEAEGLDAADAAASAADAGTDGAVTAGQDAAQSCLNSFTGDTPITLADGNQEPISKVKVGDKILATDPQSGETKAEPVVALFRHSGEHAMVLVTLADGSVLDATSGHKIWDATQRKFIDARGLHVGDQILTAADNLIPVAALTEYTASVTAYNLQISSIHTYYAGATPVLVHNSCGMLGENGTQVTSKTLTPPGSAYRVDVENPAPGVRPGQLHLQTRGGAKYLYDFNQDEFVGLPSSIAREVGRDPAVARAITKGRAYLGLR